MLPKKYRLPAKEFQYLYKKGVKAKGKYGMLIFAPNNLGKPLFGFVVSKKIGNSVHRHRMTRLLRVISIEAIKEYELENVGRSFQFVAFEFCNEYKTLKDEFFGLIEKVILIKNDEKTDFVGN